MSLLHDQTRAALAKHARGHDEQLQGVLLKA